MPCPMCNKDPVTKYRPFCSNRCADLDLGKWLTGAYVIPAIDTLMKRTVFHQISSLTKVICISLKIPLAPCDT